MDITIGSFEMNRTHPAHIGSKPLNASIKADAESQTKLYGARETLNGGSKKKASFESYILEAVNAMNDQQLKVSQLEEQVIVDPESVDPQDVTIAMAKAQASMDLAHTVISRLINGWTELSQNR